MELGPCPSPPLTYLPEPGLEPSEGKWAWGRARAEVAPPAGLPVGSC